MTITITRKRRKTEGFELLPPAYQLGPEPATSAGWDWDQGPIEQVPCGW
jgi:hypothetical protein